MPDITINIRIRRDIKRQLQFYACDRDIPLRILTDSILSDWVQKQEILIISPPSVELIDELDPADFARFPKESLRSTL